MNASNMNILILIILSSLSFSFSLSIKARSSKLTLLSSSFSSIDIEKSNKKNENKQLYNSMLTIAIPSLAGCIAEPILTLVDTYCVGKFMPSSISTSSLAAMSVNGAIFNVIAAAFYPLCTATTSMVSKSLGKLKKNDINDDDIINYNELKIIFSHGLIICIMGIPLAAILFLAGEPLINLLINSDTDLTVKIGAIKYLKIRALAIPFTLLNDVVFGFSLGLQNITAPMYSILIAFLANICLDIALIKYFNLGLYGAALATSFSGVLGSTIGLYILQKKFKLLRSQYLFELDMNKMKDFFRTSTIMFAGVMLNTLTYSSGATISSFSKSKNTIDVAAYQIIMGAWWLLSYFSSPVGYIAQALLPKEIVSDSVHNPKINNIISICIKLAVIVAICTSTSMVILQLLLPGLFTNDLAVQQAFKRTIVPVVLSLFLICITTVQDGIFIGMGKIWDYVLAGLFSTSAAWLFFSRSVSIGLGVFGAWQGLLIFSVTRFLFYCYKWRHLRLT